MEATAQRASLRLCSRSFHAFALKPERPFETWLADLDQWLARTPGFFDGKAIVLDLLDVSLEKPEVTELVAEIEKRNIRVLGMDTSNPDHHGKLPILRGKTAAEEVQAEGVAQENAASATENSSPTLIIEGPVRSGQSIVNNDGDVIVVGSVSSAAEIIAVGSIHVYGTLRGRALAGALGDDRARIFCRRMEAELIAIDGHYLLADDLEAKFRGNAIKAWLTGATMQLALQD